MNNGTPKENILYSCIACITIDSVINFNKKNYPQVYLEESKDRIKKTQMPKFIKNELKSESDSESDSDELIAKLKDSDYDYDSDLDSEAESKSMLEKTSFWINVNKNILDDYWWLIIVIDDYWLLLIIIIDDYLLL